MPIKKGYSKKTIGENVMREKARGKSKEQAVAISEHCRESSEEGRQAIQGAEEEGQEMRFPTLLYKCPGLHQCAGGTYSYKAAADEVELAALIGAGWFHTLPDAIEGEADDNSQPTRAELEKKATELGIKFDGRTTDAGLLRKINAELEQA